MAERAVPTRKRSRSHTKRFCDHCSCYVSKSTWYNHREFRDPSTVSMAGLYSEVRVNVAEVSLYLFVVYCLHTSHFCFKCVYCTVCKFISTEVHSLSCLNKVVV